MPSLVFSAKDGSVKILCCGEDNVIENFTQTIRVRGEESGAKIKKFFLRKQAERKKQILINGFLSLQNFNLLGQFQFHKQQSVINIDEMISFLNRKSYGSN